MQVPAGRVLVDRRFSRERPPGWHPDGQGTGSDAAEVLGANSWRCLCFEGELGPSSIARLASSADFACGFWPQGVSDAARRVDAATGLATDRPHEAGFLPWQADFVTEGLKSRRVVCRSKG